MPIRVQCPECGKNLKVPEKLAGKSGKCPACGKKISIPADDPFDFDLPAGWEAPDPSPAAPQPVGPEISQAPVGQLPENEYYRQVPSDVEGYSLFRNEPGPLDEEPHPVAKPNVKKSIQGVERVSKRKKLVTPVSRSSGRDHLIFLFALALIPLAISVIAKPEPLEDRIAKVLDELPGGGVETVEDEAAFFEQLPEHRIPGAHLPRKTWMHWVYAGISATVFLGLLMLIADKGENPLRLLTYGGITGTVGIFLLLSFQWFALLSNGFWLRGRGLVILIFLVIKFIGFSYICALDPEVGFPLSFLGFTCGVGLCEELCKGVPIAFYLSDQFTRPTWRGALMVGLASGIGFGVSEGITYSADYYNGVHGGLIYLVRFASCVSLHAVWAGSVALAMFRDQTYCTMHDFEWTDLFYFVAKYLGVAMILHGLYDTLLKKEMPILALLVAGLSWAWLGYLFYNGRAEWDEEG